MQQVLTLIGLALLLLFVAGALLWINPFVAAVIDWDLEMHVPGSPVRFVAACGEKVRVSYVGITILSKCRRRVRAVSAMSFSAIRMGLLRSVPMGGREIAEGPISHVFIDSSPRFLLETGHTVLIACIAMALTQMLSGLSKALPGPRALAIGVQVLFLAVQQGYITWIDIAGSEASLVDVLALLDQPLPVDALKLTNAPVLISRSIRLSGVRYAYGGSGNPLIIN